MDINKFIKNCNQNQIRNRRKLLPNEAQNALKSSLGSTLGLNFSSFGTGSQRMETGIQKMDVGIQKMGIGMFVMRWSTSQYPVKKREEIDRRPNAEGRNQEPRGRRCSNILIDPHRAFQHTSAL